MEEETGIDIEDLHFLTAVNTVMQHQDETRHYVTVFMVCCVKDADAEPKVRAMLKL